MEKTVKPKKRTKMRVIAATHQIGMFAVMRHASKQTRAHFSMLHPTYESAVAEALRLVAQMANGAPERQHTFYVMEVAATFSAGIDGLTAQER